MAPNYGHGMNALLIGDKNNGDPTILKNWCLTEPQNDKRGNQIKSGDWNLPKNCEIIIDRPYRVYPNKGVGSHIKLVKFNIMNGIPKVDEDSINQNLILSRPDPVQVAQNKPVEFSLDNNYPNPFNALTTIKYSVEKPGNISLEIYNLNGQKLETLVDEHQSVGKHSVNWNADNYPSGTYIYQLRQGRMKDSGKMSLVK